MEETWTVWVDDGASVSTLRTLPEGRASNLVFVYAPGAGSNLHDPFGAYLAPLLAGHGYECWRFQFPYSERGRKAPDRPPVLEATWRAVIESASGASAPAVGAGRARRLVIGGRSMGGRIASLVAAKGAPVAGLALFAYPLIPPGRAATDRADHFGDITVPVLLCSGTRDSFATPDQLREAASRLPGAALRFLEGADHGFNVLKASGRTRNHVWQEAGEALLGFLESL